MTKINLLVNYREKEMLSAKQNNVARGYNKICEFHTMCNGVKNKEYFEKYCVDGGDECDIWKAKVNNNLEVIARE